jgi:hypothetical protein
MGRRRRPCNAGVEDAGSHQSGMEEVGVKQCERGWRGADVEETGPFHPSGVGSGRKGAVQTRGREAELARALREAERPRRSRRGRSGVRNHPDIRALVFPNLKSIYTIQYQ